MNTTKTITILIVLILIAVVVIAVTSPNTSTNISPTPTPTLAVACTQEAKICPDGSSVGRVGPMCEFAACPSVIPSTSPTLSPTPTSSGVPKDGDLTLSIGQNGKVGDLNITLNSFVSDSRCPVDVNCIQAGSVTVNAKLTDKTHAVTRNFTSMQAPYDFGIYHVSIVSVTPPKESTSTISKGDYQITFHVTAN